MRKSVFIFALILLMYQLANGQELIPADKLKTVEGKVVQKDWVSSTIIVKCFSTDVNSPNDEITIVVPRAAKIVRGTGSIQLGDIEETDNVIVTYYNDGFNGLKAVSIQDENLSNE